jgi:aldehyde:ferredoxin oxidoreductase
VIPGYHGNLLDVDLSTGTIANHGLDRRTLQGTVGGTGLGARILLDEIEARIDPLSEDAVLLFLAGPFAATSVPCGDRTSVVCKSPLTGVWADSDVGGKFAGTLRSCGYDGLVVRGRADTPVFLQISEDGAQIRNAEFLWGLDTYRTHEVLEGQLGGRISSMAIGPAGEGLVLLASIVSDGKDARVAARCGMGAVMGSKMLKAVVAGRGGRRVSVHDPEGLRKSLRQTVRSMTELTGSLGEFGTSSGVEDCHVLEDFPVKNWQLRRWDRIGELSGVKLAETVLRGRYHCARCPIGCGRVVQVSSGPYRTPRFAGGPEYETLGSLGGNLLVSDLEAVTLANDLCNRYGMDTISVGQVIGLACESFERGYLSEGDLDGLSPRWGDPESLISLVRWIGEKRGIGEQLGKGVRRACAALAGGDPELDLQVKGLEIPSHDPRAFASIALGYATSPRGACHLQAYSHGVEAWLEMPELGFPEILDRFSAQGKAELTVKMQDLMSLFDSLKMCKFVLYAGVNIATLVEWLDRVTGWGFDKARFMETGRRIFELKLRFNRREGVLRADDRLPGRLSRDEIGGKLPRMLDEYYRIRGGAEDSAS